MVRRMSLGVLSVVLLVSVGAQAWGEDLQPPSWRGLPGTSWVQWEFLQEWTEFPAHPTPDAGFLPYGDPTIDVTPGPGAGWSALQPTYELGGTDLYNPPGDPGDGWFNLSGEIVVTLQNQDVPNPHKEVWIQLVWEPQQPENVPILQLLEPEVTPESTIPLVRTTLWETTDAANPWRAVYHDVWHFDIAPNPAFETISIRGGINVDELVIDTYCVPEPSVLVILGSAGVCLLVFARRRRG